MILHLMGDFYLQTEKVAKCKNAKIDIDCQDCIKCKKKSFRDRRKFCVKAE